MKLSFKSPSDSAIRDFLARSGRGPFSYPEPGVTLSGHIPGFKVDHTRGKLGEGRAVFDLACDALRHWTMFPRPWTRIEPANAPIEVGSVVAMLARVFGLWWWNTCRIVYVLDEREPLRRFGFAYGTLADHVERGEERFSIEWHDDDSVWYDIRAISRPNLWLLWLAYPLTRRLQRRFARDSVAAMKRAVTEAQRAGVGATP